MRNFAAVSVGERTAVASRDKVRLWLECAASTSGRPGSPSRCTVAARVYGSTERPSSQMMQRCWWGCVVVVTLLETAVVYMRA